MDRRRAGQGDRGRRAVSGIKRRRALYELFALA
jgi:hypothetical protein